MLFRHTTQGVGSLLLFPFGFLSYKWDCISSDCSLKSKRAMTHSQDVELDGCDRGTGEIALRPIQVWLWNWSWGWHHISGIWRFIPNPFVQNGRTASLAHCTGTGDHQRETRNGEESSGRKNMAQSSWYWWNENCRSCPVQEFTSVVRNLKWAIAQEQPAHDWAG